MKVYREIAKHIFEAHPRYNGERILIILADSQEEAEIKAREALGLSSPIVSRITATNDPQVYEI